MKFRVLKIIGHNLCTERLTKDIIIPFPAFLSNSNADDIRCRQLLYILSRPIDSKLTHYLIFVSINHHLMHSFS